MPRYKSMRELDYRVLAEFRQRVRGYLRFSEQAAHAAGIEPQQYQLLLAVKGLPAGAKPTIRELSERLLIEHNSAVGLTDRLERNGLVERRHDPDDHRQIIIHLTSTGESVIEKLVSHHRDELRKTAPELIAALTQVIAAAGPAE